MMHLDKTISSSQIIPFNPILEQDEEKKAIYYQMLRSFIRFSGFEKRKIVRSQMNVYKDFLVSEAFNARKKYMMSDDAVDDYKYLMIYDFLYIIAYVTVYVVKHMRRILTIKLLKI